MTRKKYFTLFTLLLLAAVWLTGCTGSKQPPGNNPSTSPSVTEPTLTGGELAAARCAECHTLDRLTSQPRDDAEWRQVAERMLEKSPDLLTPAEFELVVAYLLEQDH
jgi:mono/diheme cytochrome c family protein